MILEHLKDPALMTAGMVWQTAWSRILGFKSRSSQPRGAREPPRMTRMRMMG